MGGSAMTINWTQPRGEIRSLTGLRGCAAILVMLYHFTLEMPGQTNSFRQFLQNGYLWVDLFFILSGFVMAYSQAQIFSNGYQVRLHLSFLVGRLARIYPLYAVVIIETACLLYWRTEHPDLLASLSVLGMNLVLLQAWFHTPSLEGAAWSISTEWAAYLLFPLLLTVTVLSRQRFAWLSLAASSLIILGLAMYSGPVAYAGQSRVGPLDLYSALTLAPVARCLAEFSLGLLVFRVVWIKRLREQTSIRFATEITVISLIGALCQPDYDLIVIILFCGLLVLLVSRTSVVSRALSAPVPYRLGQWSYSIYLLHDKFRRSSGELQVWLSRHIPLSALLAVGLTSGLVIGASFLTYTLIEKPLRHLISYARAEKTCLNMSFPSQSELIISPTATSGSSS